ncbi:MAG: acyltransferase family protein, partial [Roseburia sp.]|nr:acyltransferase family protein [Roseburia sp.]
MKKTNEIGWVHGIKGFSCIAVVMLHLLACFLPDFMSGGTFVYGGVYNFISLTPLNIFFNGSFCVYIFWTVSAFLLALKWNKNKSIEAMRESILNKYFKMVIPVFIVTIV